MSLPSPDEINAAMTPEGGWTKETLAGWGVPWPPPKGWCSQLVAEWEKANEARPQPVRFASRPFLAVLDLTATDAYCAIATALEEYASRCDFDAEGRAYQAEQTRIDDSSMIADLRQSAKVARDLLEDIERQFDEV